MAVSSEVARVVHTANGTATFFSFAPIDGATSANLKVYLFNPATGVLTLQTLGTDYTFGSGGVTFFTAPPSGRRVILFRQVELLQPDIYKTNAPFPAVVTEKRFDEIVKGIQQINDVAQNRAIILPLGDAGFSANTLPAVENRKGRVLYFNATTGDPEAQFLADTTVVAPPWAVSFLSQASAAAGLADIGGVAKAGDTMTGFLTLHADPTAAMHAATKQYVDAITVPTNYVLRAGDTMTGFLTLHADPTSAMHAVTKQYVDRAYSSIENVTSATVVDFIGIPSWANKITMFVVGMATTSNALRVRLGDTGGFVTSSYLSYATTTGGTVASASATNGFITNGSEFGSTFYARLEVIRQRLLDRWLFVGRGSYSIPGTFHAAGYLNADLVLDRVRLYVPSGTMTGQCYLEWSR